MKKLLIGTSALVAAATVAGAAQAADPIKLSVGGYGAVIVGYASNSEAAIGAPGAGRQEVTGVDVKGDNEVYFTGSTKLDNGLTVSVAYQWESGGRNGATAPDHSDEYRISVGGSFGTVIAGATNNALVMIAKGAPRVGGRLFNGGVDEGDLVSGNYVLRPFNQGRAANGPGLAPNATFVQTNGDAESISYVSPSFAGFTFGASYVPDAGAGDDNPLQPNGGNTTDAYGVGAAYNGEFSGVGIALQGGWLTADTAINDWNEFQVGGQISYAGFALGSAVKWQEWDLTGGPNDDGTNLAWEVGASYTTGPYGVSLVYFDSYGDNGRGVSDDRIQVVELAGQYNMGPGVNLVGGIAWVDFQNGVAPGARTVKDDNDGWVVASGLSLTF